MMRRWYNKHMRNDLRGFTIIELSLSIAFIAILSLTVVLIIMNSVSTYRKGLMMNQINTTGMDLVDDFRAAVQNSSAGSVASECDSIVFSSESYRTYCKNEKGLGFVSVRRNVAVKPAHASGSGQTVPVYGAFCTGSYSYIWNSGYFFSGEHIINNDVSYKPADLKYNLLTDTGEATHTWSTDNPGKTFKLLKIEDGERAVCKTAIRVPSKQYVREGYTINGNSSNNTFDITGFSALESEPVDVLESSKSLAIYYLWAPAPADSVTMNNMFYSVSFILGTVQGGINLKNNDRCARPNDLDNQEVENFDYCAINKFNFAVQANGG